MSGYKSARMSEDIKREMSFLLRSLKDPRINSGNLSVVRVDVSKDCSFAKIYISSMKGIKDANLAVKALKGAAGYIKRKFLNNLHLKKMIEVKFIADDSIEYGAHLERLFAESLKGE
ncbi:MAG: 30S ribosome-binding factor RbfA [Oscillospiraceae bacterium]|nr:30S ribosome-binding factor RbfA [Oscillospiraceae bacterium]